MSLILYGISSPNVVKILIMLEELSELFAFQHIDLFSGSQFSADFQQLNPNSKVPLLVTHDGKAIFESGAILLYLAEASGRFLPKEGNQRYDVIQWLMLQNTTVGPLLGQLNHFVSYAPEGEDYALGRYRREAKRIYAMLDKRLEGFDYLAGHEYTIADMATLPWTDYIENHGLDRLDYPALNRWRTALEQREAVIRARRFMRDVQERDGEMFARASPTARRRFLGLDE